MRDPVTGFRCIHGSVGHELLSIEAAYRAIFEALLYQL